MSDDLAAALDEIRESAEDLTPSHDDDDCRPGSSCTAHDALRMVAALDEVLKLHTRSGQPVRFYDLERYSCTHCREDDWPCLTVQAISRALLMPIRSAG